MLRTLVVLLLLLNLIVFGWTRGWMDSWSPLKARGDREPERVDQQQHAELVRILPTQTARALQTRDCLELGPVREESLAAVQAQLVKASLNAGSGAGQWQDLKTEQGGVWALASIKMPNKEFQQRKEETYRRLKISYEYLSGMPEEMPTMILSRHSSEKAAQAALDQAAQHSLKGLRVLPLQTPQTLHTLQFAQLDGVLKAQVQDLFRTPPQGASLHSCSAPPATAAAASAAAPGATTIAGHDAR
ncbi:MAG: hypothetical protein JOY60_09740 [Burkholderiaceae bacterium]|nr:hypothetical protein [Burkholderiaceae bacterium]